MNPTAIYITAKDAKQAAVIGEALVAERLVACVNILGNMKSIYRWKGTIERDDEVVIIAKTRESLVDSIVNRVKQLHSYEVPCIVAMPITGGNPDYIRWILDETK